jgi:predicted nucleic acid-binding protein
MIAVSDTSPICYLILIGEVDLLQRLFDQLVLPRAVLAELLNEDAPEAVRAWAARLPSWIAVRENPSNATIGMERWRWTDTNFRYSAALLKSAIDRYGRKPV